eukprot:TRINITY_DN806_c0_g1_i12.p1 TRINITY_DN806_c0_g1~~TRINITY_DN806_c0_g1_i12.p1  ORF type:complete len:208 (+),score=52.25 TRINITY_DN806_c0_g1_i12:795-1418(+)
MNKAVHTFTGAMPPEMLESFFKEVLLSAVRKDIQEHHKLNVHYYQALKRALFKPSAFFKGIIFPLAKEATAQEAIIVGSILSKMSIPSVHASVAMIMLTEMDYTLCSAYLLKILLAKNYSLSDRVVGALVAYFSKFRNDKRPLPVLWHQTLLLLVTKYYRMDGVNVVFLTTEHKALIADLIKVKNHSLISPEIAKALNPEVGAMTDV